MRMECEAAKPMTEQLGKQDRGEYFCSARSGAGRRCYLRLVASGLQLSECACRSNRGDYREAIPQG
jgi:hypothetical protein